MNNNNMNKSVAILLSGHLRNFEHIIENFTPLNI